MPPDTPPGWFRSAPPPTTASITVDGARIHLEVRGSETAPTVVLVHGGAAHTGWWAGVAPWLATDHRVVALDLSGHGRSDRRETYHVETWAAEVVAAAEAAGGAGRPVVIGHSMGGFVTLVVAAHHGAALDGAIILDTPVMRPDPESAEGRRGGMFRAPKTYPDLATAMAHFHLVPPQPVVTPWLVAEVARQSLVETPAGWGWRFDPRVFTARPGPAQPSAFAPLLAGTACRFAVVVGERSALVGADIRAYMAELLAGSPAARAGVPFVLVPEAHHHLLLDQPLATATALRTVLATWRPVGVAPSVDG